MELITKRTKSITKVNINQISDEKVRCAVRKIKRHKVPLDVKSVIGKIHFTCLRTVFLIRGIISK